MDARFKSLSLFDFQAQFPNEESCFAYLANLNGQMDILVADVKTRTTAKV